jgi:hypothetical protein
LVSLFKTFKLWTLISGEREMPDKVKDPQGYLEYMEDDQVAGDRIVRSLDLGLQLAVDVIPLAKDKFKHLEKQFAQKQESEALDSWSKLTGLRFNPTRMTWNEFLLLYRKYIAEMAQHGMILNDPTRCMVLQGAVKHVFNTRQIVLVIKKESLTEARLKDEIQAEYQRMKGNNSTWKHNPDEDELEEPKFMGMINAGAKNDSRGTKRKFNHEDTAYCTYHEKYGHWTRTAAPRTTMTVEKSPCTTTMVVAVAVVAVAAVVAATAVAMAVEKIVTVVMIMVVAVAVAVVVAVPWWRSWCWPWS